MYPCFREPIGPSLLIIIFCYIQFSLDLLSRVIYLSSTNATKVYADADIPEVFEMRERCPDARPPCHITIPNKKGKLRIHFNPDNRKTILQLLSAK
ncbi:hypothetical protein MKX03_011462 [Papaver bracteatum]|nr:hypothetical protein MKX03_011462 [Papaver bracteatum]